MGIKIKQTGCPTNRIEKGHIMMLRGIFAAVSLNR